MERNSLSKAHVNLEGCNYAVSEARRSQPAVPPLSEVTIDHGHLMGDILFDNVFSDFAQHNRIQESAAQMQKAMSHLQRIIAEQKQRTQAAQEQQ